MSKLKPVPSATRMWQDIDRQHPVTEEGQPVAYWEAPPFDQVFISPKRSQRPTATKWKDQWGVELREDGLGMQVKK